jgi:flagellar motor switch protein FliN
MRKTKSNHAAHDGLADAERAVREMLATTNADAPASVHVFQLPELDDRASKPDPANANVEKRVRPETGETTVAAAVADGADADGADADAIDVRIELGRTRLGHDDIRRLRNGSIVSLDGRIDEPVDIRAGGRLIGRGDVMVLDGKIGVRVVELFEQDKQEAQL